MSQPGFFFYTGDWVKDTRVLSPLVRGCWIDALCFLNENQGTVTWPIASFANFWNISNDVAIDVLDAIAMAKVGNVEWPGHSKTIAKLSNRRMIREISKRLKTKEKRAEAGKKGAAIRWQKCDSSESSSSSESESSSYKSPPANAGPVNNSEKKTPGNPFEPIIRLAAEIGMKDKIETRNETSQKLVQWTVSMVRTLKNEPQERVLAVTKSSLEIVRAKIESGYEIKSLWGLLRHIFDKERTKYMQGPENQAFKNAPMGSFGEILNQIAAKAAAPKA